MSSFISDPEVDRALRFSEHIPDFGEWLRRMAEDSAPVPDALSLERLSFGGDTRQWLELGLASGSAPILPVLIHGGYWRALRAEDHRFALMGLKALGPLVGNLEYRLMPDARINDLVADAIGGLLAAAKAHPHLNLLPIGHSAGAHLALSALANEPALAGKCAGVVAISGAFDLGLIARSFLQAELALTQAEIIEHTITSAPDLPCLFVVGSKETAPFRDQALALAATRNTARMLTISPCHHMNILHGSLYGAAPLVPTLQSWLAGEDIPDTLEASIP
jgi:arylformamidase